MSDEKYEAQTDIEQSGVRFVSTEPGDDAIDFNCERLVFAVESFCGGRDIVPEIEDDDEEEEPDRLDPLFEADDFPQPFIDLVYENKEDIFQSNSNQTVIEFTFNCVFSIIFEHTDTLNDNIDKLSVILSSQSEIFNKLNIKLLCLLFNLIPSENRLRCVVMQRLLDLAKKTSSTLVQELFRGRLDPLEEWIENDWFSWLNICDKKGLYSSASSVAYKAAEKDIYLKYLIKYLSLFNNDDIDYKEDEEEEERVIIDEAAQAVIAAISSNTFNTKNVMELIRSHIVCNVMSKTRKYMELYNLLNIVYCGDVADFEIFYNKNRQLFEENDNDKSLGLIYNDLQSKMRLLTLCSLGSINNGKESNSYSFDELKNKLQINTQNELESVIIDAITKKLLFAKINYELNQIDITRAKQRTFNKNSWCDLSNKLSVWRQNTNTVLQILHNAGLNRWRQQYMQQMAKQQAKNQKF